MRKLIVLVMVAMGIAGVDLNAQKPVTLGEDSLLFGKMKLPCLTVNIPEVEFERTQKSWIKKLQAGTKSQVVNENGKLSIFGAKIKEISASPVNVYSELVSRDSLITLMVVFELKKDEYLQRSSGSELFTSGNAFLKSFARDQYVDLVKDQINREDKILKDYERDLNGLENDKQREQKSIQSNKSLIITENDNIVIQNNEITKLTPEIIEMNNQLTSMEEGTVREEKAAYIKELEKRKKKALNEIEASERRISKANASIGESENQIPRIESQQDVQRKKIAEQEIVVQNFRDKLRIVEGY